MFEDRINNHLESLEKYLNNALYETLYFYEKLECLKNSGESKKNLNYLNMIDRDIELIINIQEKFDRYQDLADSLGFYIEQVNNNYFKLLTREGLLDFDSESLEDIHLYLIAFKEDAESVKREIGLKKKSVLEMGRRERMQHNRIKNRNSERSFI